MSFDYILDPKKIEQESFRQIRQLSDLSHLKEDEQQVAMRVIHSCGVPKVVNKLRFSSQACESGLVAIKQNVPILCDVEMVKQGITKRMIESQPLCFLNDPETTILAQKEGETRSMAALKLWQKHLKGSIVVIGNAPTALFRLLEMLQCGADKPALVVGIPVGFVGAAESKQALWDLHEKIGIECITLLGKQGGSAIASSVVNALLRCHRGERY